MKNLTRLFCLIILLTAQNGWAQNSKREFFRREVNIGQDSYGYRVYVPLNRDEKQKLPVMMFLHGNGANGTDNEKQVEGGTRIVYQNPKIFNFIIVFPQARPNAFWVGRQTEQAMKALDQATEESNGDTQRLYLSGHSLGGYGTWTTAALYPNKFAALVPVSGGIVPPFEVPPMLKLLFPPPLTAILNSSNPYDALAEKIGNTPVWDFHGAEDESVPVKESRNIVEALKKRGSKNVNYTEYAKTNHNDALLKAFQEPKLFEWLAKQKLNK